jgi:hypothetical protein
VDSLSALSWRATILSSASWIIMSLVSWALYVRTRPGLARGLYIYHVGASHYWARGTTWLLFVFVPPAALLIWKLFLFLVDRA